MRLMLDTNVLVFHLYDPDALSTDVRAQLLDYSNVLFTSTVCVQELIHLCCIGKLARDGRKVLNELSEAGINIEQVTERHLAAYAALPLYDDHRDPADRLIIAQAMADRVPLVSSDRKFSRYVRHGLSFVFNER